MYTKETKGAQNSKVNKMNQFLHNKIGYRNQKAHRTDVNSNRSGQTMGDNYFTVNETKGTQNSKVNKMNTNVHNRIGYRNQMTHRTNIKSKQSG